MDGAFSQSEQVGGIGIIVRDNMGNCVGSKCVRVCNVTSSEHVEAMAGRVAVRLAQDGGLSSSYF